MTTSRKITTLTLIIIITTVLMLSMYNLGKYHVINKQEITANKNNQNIYYSYIDGECHQYVNY